MTCSSDGAPRGICRAISLLSAAWLLTASVPTHAASLSGTLPTSATDALLFAVDCSNTGTGEPASLTAQVRDLAPTMAPIVSLQIRKDFSAKNTSDDIDGDANPSPVVAVNGGAGRYNVYVDKNAAGEELFEVTAQCWTGVGGSGSMAGTDLFAAQGGPVPTASFPAQILLAATLLITGFLALGISGRKRAAGRSLIIGVLSCAAFCQALSMSVAPEAGAHSQSGRLGMTASATDYYAITCFDDGHGQPGSIEVQIRDASPGALPHVSVQAHRGFSLRSVSDDLLNDIQPSIRIFVNEGQGTYFVLVDKTGPGVKFYDLTYHCWTGPNGTGIHTGANLLLQQDE